MTMECSLKITLVWSVDTGNISLLVLLDLSADFDTADHEILLSVRENRFQRIPLLTAGLSRTYLNEFSHPSMLATRLTHPVDCSVP